MATINTYNKPEMAALSYAQTDPLANLVYNQAFPPMDSLTESGKFREVEARAHYLQIADDADKYTTPETFNYSDSFRFFHNVPVAAGFKFSNADLRQPQQYGYASREAMIESRRAWLTKLMKKGKEKALYTFVSDNTNFEGATYYANAATAWSTVGTADPRSDIEAGRLIVDEINAMIISHTAWRYLVRNANLNASSLASGPMRDGNVNPTATLDFVKNYLELDYIFVSRGKLITDSSDPTDETRTEIWGDKALLFFHNPTPAPEEPSWMKNLFWRPSDGAESMEGWLVNETLDPRAGGAGIYYWDIWNYGQYLLHEKNLAYRIDNLY